MVKEARHAAVVVIVTALFTGVGPSVSPGAAASDSWTVASGDVRVSCRMTVGGRFDAVTSALSGRLLGTAQEARSYAGSLRVDLATLDTGIGLRDTHLRDRYLEVQRGPAFRYAVLSGIALDEPPPAGGDRHETSFAGTLALHGVEHTIEGEVEITRRDGRMEVEAAFSLSLDAFGIPPPRHLGVGVRDEIAIGVRFVAVSSGEGPPDGAP